MYMGWRQHSSVFKRLTTALAKKCLTVLVLQMEEEIRWHASGHRASQQKILEWTLTVQIYKPADISAEHHCCLKQNLYACNYLKLVQIRTYSVYVGTISHQISWAKEANAEGTNKVAFPNVLLTIKKWSGATAFACLKRLPYIHLL